MLEITCRICGRTRPATEDFCPHCTAAPRPDAPRPRCPAARVDTGLVTRWGGGHENPTVAELQDALRELDSTDPEHPSAWLTDYQAYTVIVYDTGLVQFLHECTDLAEKEHVLREHALELWLLLQQGRRDEILRRLTP